MASEFERALRLMRRRDSQAAEDGFGRLRELAADHVDELIDAFGRETDHGVRCWLLELIGEARSVKAFELLVGLSESEDESLRGWGRRGLRLLDTKEARRVLWRQER